MSERIVIARKGEDLRNLGADELLARSTPVITSVRYWTETPRKQPKAGDRRTTKKHGEQVRVYVTHNGMRVMTGGHKRYVYEWVSLDDPRALPYSKARQS